LYGDPTKDYLFGIVVPDKLHLKSVENSADCDQKIQKIIMQYGLQNGLEKFELPAKLLVTQDEWTSETGLVTAAFKIRRKHIVEKYRRQIDLMYT
jgi:long-chain acyl-CoA synthetase